MDPVSKAQGSGITEKQRANLRPWQKGQSGNPSGRPKKLRITKMYEKVLGQPATRKQIEDSIKKILTGGRMASVLMLREMAERTEGKVAQEVDMNVTGTVALAAIIQERREKKASGSNGDSKS